MPPMLNAGATIRTRTTTDLITWAEADGAVILWSPDLPERGRYIRALDAIVLRHGMTERRTLSNLATSSATASTATPAAMSAPSSAPGRTRRTS